MPIQRIHMLVRHVAERRDVGLHGLQGLTWVLFPLMGPGMPLCPVPGNDTAQTTGSGEDARQGSGTQDIQCSFRIHFLQRLDGGKRLNQVAQARQLNHQVAAFR